jgi:hypothetical protein
MVEVESAVPSAGCGSGLNNLGKGSERTARGERSDGGGNAIFQFLWDGGHSDP